MEEILHLGPTLVPIRLLILRINSRNSSDRYPIIRHLPSSSTGNSRIVEIDGLRLHDANTVNHPNLQHILKGESQKLSPLNIPLKIELRLFIVFKFTHGTQLLTNDAPICQTAKPSNIRSPISNPPSSTNIGPLLPFSRLAENKTNYPVSSKNM